MDKHRMAIAFLDSELSGPEFVASQPEELREMAAESVSGVRDVAAFLTAPEPSVVAKARAIEKLRGRLQHARRGEYSD